MSPTYAAGTSVPVSRSRDEVEKILTRYGADQFGFATSPSAAMIMFVVNGRQVRLVVPLPDRDGREFTRSEQNRARTAESALRAWEQACRQRWRALVLVVKAKLEAVEAGIVTFDQEFAMHMVLPDGSVVGDQVIPRIQLAYESGETPSLLPGPTS